MCEAPRNYSGDRTLCCGQCMQKANSYCWSQVITVFIRQNSHTFSMARCWSFTPGPALVRDVMKFTGFHGFQNGFLDFKVDFWISKWISRFQSGFLDFKQISGFQSGFLDFIWTAIILLKYTHAFLSAYMLTEYKVTALHRYIVHRQRVHCHRLCIFIRIQRVRWLSYIFIPYCAVFVTCIFIHIPRVGWYHA